MPTMEFHINRAVRDEYGLERALFSLTGNVILIDMRRTRELAARCNERVGKENGPDKPVNAGDLAAMGLIDEILHYMTAQYLKQAQRDVFGEALELVEYGIKVNAVCPGNFFDGPLWSDPEKGLFVQYLRTGKVPGARNVADVKAFYEAKVPMKRGCTGADVMRAIYYIIEQEYETGQAVPVTGGQVMLH